MEKTEAVNRLKKAGYQVSFDASVVSVVIPSESNLNQEIKKLRTFLAEIGYDASFGIKQQKQDVRSAEVDTSADVEVGEQFSLKDFGIDA